MSKKDLLLADFIQLRIEGLSFQAIADKLEVSKQTLLEWNKQITVKDAIAEGSIFKVNEMIRAYEMDRQKRLEGLLQFRKKLNDELMARSLEQIPTQKLFDMVKDATEQIKNEFCPSVEIGTNPNIFNTSSGNGFFYFNADE
ncbi:MAG TPA: hypothetical protein VGN63_01310 [Flavisolibacter sp.]|jgi:predicted DNA-binding protein YlxM (UPF0122 family)|nr:hypothetical protein [Flavisolibacter sp.]